MDYEKAVEYQKLRLDIATQLRDRDGEAKGCAALGALYHGLKDFPNSIRYLSISYSDGRSTKLDILLANVKQHILRIDQILTKSAQDEATRVLTAKLI